MSSSPAAYEFIVADNEDALRNLAESGRAYDLIYIDPPYNTGNSFVYHDKRDRQRDGGRGQWVDMMRPRLQLAREVLRPTGVIAVSIDDHEVAQLRVLLDEIFGYDNFIAQIVVSLNPKGRQLGKFFATCHEYVVMYAAALDQCVLEASTTTTVNPRDFRHIDPATGRRYRQLPLRNTNARFNPQSSPSMYFELYGDPKTGKVSVEPFEGAEKIVPVFGSGAPAVWRWSRQKISSQPDDVLCRTVRGTNGHRTDVFQKDWLHEGRRKRLRTIWTSDEVGSIDAAIADLKSVIGRVFETPKPVGLINRLLETMPHDAAVLDFFAGSATTGHAVYLANQHDKGRRTVTLVNSAEPTPPGSAAEEAGYVTVADIGIARMQSVLPQGALTVRYL